MRRACWCRARDRDRDRDRRGEVLEVLEVHGGVDICRGTFGAQTWLRRIASFIAALVRIIVGFSRYYECHDYDRTGQSCKTPVWSQRRDISQYNRFENVGLHPSFVQIQSDVRCI